MGRAEVIRNELVRLWLSTGALQSPGTICEALDGETYGAVEAFLEKCHERTFSTQSKVQLGVVGTAFHYAPTPHLLRSHLHKAQARADTAQTRADSERARGAAGLEAVRRECQQQLERVTAAEARAVDIERVVQNLQDRADTRREQSIRADMEGTERAELRDIMSRLRQQRDDIADECAELRRSYAESLNSCHSPEDKRSLDAIARALHPHWPVDSRNGYDRSALASMVDKLRQQLDEQSQGIDSYHERVAKLQTRVTSLCGTLSDKDGELEALEALLEADRDILKQVHESMRSQWDSPLYARTNPAAEVARMAQELKDSKPQVFIVTGGGLEELLEDDDSAVGRLMNWVAGLRPKRDQSS